MSEQGDATTDEIAGGGRRRLGLNARFAIGLGIVAVVVVGGGFGLEALQGGFRSAPTVTVRNDTGSTLNWSCTKSTLHLAPGASGTIRIPGPSDPDFGCVSGSGAHEVDTCPDPSQLIAGARFTATAWVRDFTCP